MDLPWYEHNHTARFRSYVWQAYRQFVLDNIRGSKGILSLIERGYFLTALKNMTKLRNMSMGYRFRRP